MLPGMSGLDLARHLRGLDAWRDLPIVLLSARAAVEDRVEGLRVADDYLAKPFSVRELRARVLALLAGHDGGPRAARRDQAGIGRRQQEPSVHHHTGRPSTSTIIRSAMAPATPNAMNPSQEGSPVVVNEAQPAGTLPVVTRPGSPRGPPRRRRCTRPRCQREGPAAYGRARWWGQAPAAFRARPRPPR